MTLFPNEFLDFPNTAQFACDGWILSAKRIPSRTLLEKTVDNLWGLARRTGHNRERNSSGRRSHKTHGKHITSGWGGSSRRAHSRWCYKTLNNKNSSEKCWMLMNNAMICGKDICNENIVPNKWKMFFVTGLCTSTCFRVEYITAGAWWLPR